MMMMVDDDVNIETIGLQMMIIMMMVVVDHDDDNDDG